MLGVEAVLSAAIISLFVSLFTALLLIRHLHLHQHISGDSAEHGPQKFHLDITPRIGGIPIVLGIAAGMLLVWHGRILSATTLMVWLAAITPVFGAGMLEDITKKVAPRWRLLASFVSAGLGAWLMGAALRSLAIPGFDQLLASYPLLALLVTVFAVGGICHSLNLIDGYNGLAGGVAAMILASLGYVSLKVGDGELLVVAMLTISATIGFLAWNYPRGLIFAGDGGAYLLGFMIAEISVLLVVRHPEVSPWFPFTLVVYPVWETMFTIYRRKFIQGQAAGLPDALHLHQMVFNRLVRWMVGRREAKHLRRRNSLTTPYLWGMGLMTVLPSMLFWQNTRMLQLACIVFVVIYLWLYRRLVRFRAPKWLLINKKTV